MLKTLRTLVLIAAAAWAAAASAQQSAKPAITLEVPVLPDAARHLDLLALPAYLALVLENNGLNPSLSSRVVVKDRTAFSIRSGTVQFVERKGPVFRYEGTVTIPLGLAEPGFTVPVDVDTSAIAQGKLVVRAYSGPIGGAAAGPDRTGGVQGPCARGCRVAAQGGGIPRPAGTGAPREGTRARADARGDRLRGIQPGWPGGRPAQSTAVEPEALSDQALLLITVAIWLLGFPVFFCGSLGPAARFEHSP